MKEAGDRVGEEAGKEEAAANAEVQRGEDQEDRKASREKEIR